jgi:hypothetical protein
MSKASKRDPLDDAIDRAVKGDPSSPWRIDPAHKPEGSFEMRFNAGDRQILLWAINDCAESGDPIPDWAAKALRKILYGAAKGRFNSWDDEDAFGKIFAKSARKRGIQSDARMFDVYDKVIKYSEDGFKIDDNLFKRVGKELGIGKKETVKKLWKRAKADAIKHGRHVTKPHRERVLNSKAKLKA